MRFVLPLLALAQSLGIWAADTAILSRDVSARLLFASLLCGLCVRQPAIRFAAATAAVLALGAHGLALRLDVAGPPEQVRVRELVIDATICRRSASRNFVQAELCRVTAMEPHDSPQRMRLLLREPISEATGRWLVRVPRFSRVRLRVRLRSLMGLRNPGLSSSVRRWQRRGVGARAQMVDANLAVILEPVPGKGVLRRWIGAPVRWIEGARTRVAASLADRGSGSGLVRALAIGDRSGLAAQDRDAFARLGLAHLLAVSGLHLALLTGAAFALARAALIRVAPLSERWDMRRIALFFALGVGLIYAALTGWGIPVQRSFVFLTVLALSIVHQRRRTSMSLLAAAWMIVLLREPGALFELGAQLSFAASAGLLAAVPRDPSPGDSSLGARLARVFLEAAHASAAAVAATSPILAAHGVSSGAAALIANVLAVPWFGFVVLPSSLAAAALCLGPRTGALGVGLTFGVESAIWIAGVTLEAVGTISSAAPVASSGRTPAAIAIATASVLAMFAIRCRETGRRMIIALTATLVLRFGPATELAPGPPRLVALDVGHGDAILVEGEDAAMLVDAGASFPDGGDLGRTVVVPALRALGRERLDVLVATHGDRDHRGGLVSVLEAVEVSEVWLPPRGRRDPLWRPLVVAAAARESRVVEVSADQPPRQIGDLAVRFLWPPADLAAQSTNEASLVLMVEVSGVRILLTGDLTAAAEVRLSASRVDLAADILKVAHHGSGTSSTVEFLARVEPDLALVSSACSQRRPLPDPRVWRRLEASVADLGWTGRDGALFVALRRPLEVEGWGEPRRDCWPPTSSHPELAAGPGSDAHSKSRLSAVP